MRTFPGSLKQRYVGADGSYPPLYLAMGIGLSAHLLVAIWNGFFGPSFGAEGDAVSFHAAAVEYARMPVLHGFLQGLIYSDLLGLFYFLTTPSIFIGSLLSVTVWLGSALLLRKLMRLFGMAPANQFYAMLLYGLLPSALLYTSVTLREAYELFFVNLIAYSFLEIVFEKRAVHLLTITVAAIGLGALHAALLVFGGVAMLAALASGLYADARRSRPNLVAVVLLLLSVGYFVLCSFTYFSHNRLGGGLAAAVEIFRNSALAKVRTEYAGRASIKGMMGLLGFLPGAFFQYLFEPMPWRISAKIDYALTLENLLRAWLLWRAVAGLVRSRGRQRNMQACVLGGYLVLELLWALGTLNWGTAARHHIPAMGLLIVAALVCWISPFSAPRVEQDASEDLTEIRCNRNL